MRGPSSSLIAVLAIGVTAAAPIPAQHPSVPPPPPCKPPARAEASIATGAVLERRQLSVLMFQGAVADSALVRLADGFGERIAERLATLHPRDVRDRHAGVESFLFNAAAAARALNVRYLLAGEFVPNEGALRELSLTVRLLDGGTGATTWSATFTAPQADLLALEDDIVRAVGGRVFPNGTAPKDAAPARPTSDPTAYERFLRGNSYFVEGTEQALAGAVQEYTVAVRRDAKFTAAWSRLALSHARWLHERGDVPTAVEEKVLPAGLAAAATAISLDPRPADAWLARAMLFERRSPRTLEGARAAYERALALEPRSADVHREYGRMLLYVGQVDAGRTHLRQAVSIDPGHVRALTDLAELSLYERDYGEACRLLNAAIGVEPRYADAYVLRALGRLRLREVRNAWADAETAARLGRSLAGEAVSAVVDAAARDTASARARVRRLLQRAPAAGGRPIGVRDARYLAMALGAIGDYRQAVAILERGAPRGAALWRALQDPQLSGLRADARYRELLASSSPLSARAY